MEKHDKVPHCCCFNMIHSQPLNKAIKAKMFFFHCLCWKSVWFVLYRRWPQVGQQGLPSSPERATTEGKLLFHPLDLLSFCGAIYFYHSQLGAVAISSVWREGRVSSYISWHEWHAKQECQIMFVKSGKCLRDVGQLLGFNKSWICWLI